MARAAHSRAAFESFLQQFPNSEYAKLARVELASLNAAESAASADLLDRQGRNLRASGDYTGEAALYRRGGRCR